MKLINAAIALLALPAVSAFAPSTPSALAVRSFAARSVMELEAKKSIEDLSESDLKGKKVLVRCDVNVPLDGKTITDDTRIRSSIPTIEYLKGKGAIVTVCSHLGRPKDGPEDKFSLGPCAERMGELLGQEVKLAPDCIGDEVKKIVDGASEGDVIMLENTRFYKEETKNEPGFVEKLAAPFDMFVNDAFGTAHRARAPQPPDRQRCGEREQWQEPAAPAGAAGEASGHGPERGAHGRPEIGAAVCVARNILEAGSDQYHGHAGRRRP